MTPPLQFPSVQIEDPKWQLITFGLQHRHCVLILGPNFHKDPSTGVPLRRLLANELADELGEQALFNRNDLAYVSKLYEKEKGNLLLKMKVQQFYSRHTQPSEAAKALTKLPFHLIVNSAPDHLLAEAYRQSGGGACNEGAYVMGKEQQQGVYDKNSPQPFVYNLFGSVTDVNSLVLTQDQQMQFVQSVIQRETALPDSLVMELRPDKIYIFLGFDYENWYLRFLFHLLKMSDKVENVFGLHDAVEEPTAPTKIFFSSQYKMSFVEMTDEEFLQEAGERIRGEYQPAPEAPSKQLFFLCDPEDEPLLRKLERQLSSLKKRYNLACSSNLDLALGTEIDMALQQQIDSADYLLPVVTSNFAASKISEKLLPLALARQGNGAIVLPLLMRPCDWEGTGMADLPGILPRDRNPVSRWSSRDEAMRHIVSEIENIIRPA